MRVIALLAALALASGCKEAAESLKKGKKMESTMEIQRIMEGARSYHAELGAIPEPSVGPTPPLGACCETGGKCAPDQTLWRDPTWGALQFAMYDPHYFSYEYKVDRQGDKATISALAYGDVDCDGTYSTYSVAAEVGTDGFRKSDNLVQIRPSE
jgi:hypothetical protein